MGDRLAALAAAIPAKGGEAGPITAEYLARHAMDATQAALMAVRDYWGSINTFWLPRGTGEFLDLFGAVFILASAIDYAGASDDSGAGGRDTGARKCIGDTFAMTEAILALATITARWSLKHLPGHHQTRPILGVTLRPRELRMQATPR